MPTITTIHGDESNTMEDHAGNTAYQAQRLCLEPGLTFGQLVFGIIGARPPGAALRP